MTLSHISAGLAFLPLIISLVNIKLIRGYLKPVFLLLIICVLTDSIGIIAADKQINADRIFFTYTLIEFSLISTFYIIFFRRYFRPVAVYAILVLFPISATALYFLYGVETADSFAVSVESFIFTCYCLFLFYYILKNLIFENLLASPVFWINTGILLYFTGNFCIFIFSSYVKSHATGEYSLLWRSIHTFFNIFMNIFFSIGFWKLRAK